MKLIDSTTLDPTAIILGEDHGRHLDEEKIARLLASLNAGTVLPPLVVDADYKLVAGRNRFEAYGRAGLEPRVDVVKFDDHLEAMELAIRENLDRKKLSPSQEAESLAQLVWIEEQRDALPPHRAEAASHKPRSKGERNRAVADKANVSERKVERAVKKIEEARNPTPPEPPAPVVPPPAKPVRVERLILEYAARVKVVGEEGQALLPKALAEPGRATGAAWRGNLRSAVGAIVREADVLVNVADEIKRSRGALAQVDVKSGEAAKARRQAREEKHRWSQDEEENRERALAAADSGPAQPATKPETKPDTVSERIAKGGGLKVPKRIKIKDHEDKLLAEGVTSALPAADAVKRSWDEGAAVFGPDGESEPEAF